VKQKFEYHDYLKKKIDTKMISIQHKSDQKPDKERSVLNKSIDTVAGMLKISKWWS
jgi:hypothetical protein